MRETWHLEVIRRIEPDLVLLDLMLPGMSGAQICREAREFYNGMILVLTASADEMSEVFTVRCWWLCGCRYEVMHCWPGIEALLRRATPVITTAETVPENQCEIVNNNAAQSATSLYGQNLKLTSAEFEILNLLVKNVCQVVTRDQCCQLFRGNRLRV